MKLTTKVVILLLFSFCSYLSTPAQQKAFSLGKISPYTAYLLDAVNTSTGDSIEYQQIQKRFGIRQSEEVQYINAYIEFNKEKENEVLSFLEEHNVQVNSIIGNILTVKIPVQSIENISLNTDIELIEVGIPVFPQMDKARVVSNVDAVQEGSELEMPYKGKDVVIGIIDMGFEYGHINFYNSDGTELRVKQVWNQNNKKKLKTESEILTAQYDNPMETHGTHVVGIAAGADHSNDNVYYGVAPESDLVLVSYNTSSSSTDNVSITDAIKYIYDYAESVGKPCVVNMSLGTHIGPHDGTSTFDRSCDEMSGEGRLLVGAVGNEGSDKLHISKNFTQQEDTLRTFISFYDNKKLYSYCDVWSEANKTFSVQLVIFNTLLNREVYKTNLHAAHTTEEIRYTLNEDSNGATGTISIYTGRNNKNLKANALVVTNLRTIKSYHTVGLKITATDGTVHAWTGSSFTNNNLNNWTNGNSEHSMGEIGGTGKKIISVGAYTSNSQYGGGILGNIANFSSKGPTLDDRLKPEITAPGSSIVSSYSSSAVERGGHGSRVVKTTSINNKNYYYGYMRGTSMSAPFVTGVLATWLQAKNNLTPEEAKFFLQKTAIKDEHTGHIPFDGNNTWGYGKIDALNGLKEVLWLKNMEDKAGVKLLIYKELSERYLNVIFPVDDEDVRIIISNSGGHIVQTLDVNKITSYESFYNPSRINLAKYQSGLYIIKVIGKNHTYKAEKFIVK